MKKALLTILAVMMALCLVACGGASSDDPTLGVYVGKTVELLGDEMDISEVYEGTNEIELKAGGKCKVTLGGDGIDATWTQNGSDLVITIDGMDSSATLNDGVLVFDLLDMGMPMTFVKK